MNKRSLGALIALNVVLLAGLLLITITPEPAHAQRRGRDRYVMIAGRTQDRNSQDLVYVINLDTEQIIALFYESANKNLTVVDGYTFSNDLHGRSQKR